MPGGWLSVESNSIRQQLRLQQLGWSAFNRYRCKPVAVICSQLCLRAIRRMAYIGRAVRRETIFPVEED